MLLAAMENDTFFVVGNGTALIFTENAGYPPALIQRE